MTAVAIRETVLTLLDKGVLLEMAWDDLVQFKADEYELGENLEALYELEYKHSMLRSKPFEGVPQRRENMLERLGQVAYSLAATVARQILEVYDEWLSKHAISDPHEWADARVRDAEEVEGEITTGEEITSAIEATWTEYDRYVYYEGGFPPGGAKLRGPDDSEIVQRMREGKLPSLQATAEAMMQDENENMADEEDFEPYDDPADFLESIIDAYGSLIELLQGLDWGYVEAEPSDLLRELYATLVFPAWFAHWKPLGIVETRGRIEEAAKTLEAIESNPQQLPVQQLFGKMNEIVNIAHQNGEMVEYLEERFNIDATFLEQLSERDTADWNEELQQLGVKIDG